MTNEVDVNVEELVNGILKACGVLGSVKDLNKSYLKSVRECECMSSASTSSCDEESVNDEYNEEYTEEENVNEDEDTNINAFINDEEPVSSSKIDASVQTQTCCSSVISKAIDDAIANRVIYSESDSDSISLPESVTIEDINNDTDHTPKPVTLFNIYSKHEILTRQNEFASFVNEESKRIYDRFKYDVIKRFYKFKLNCDNVHIYDINDIKDDHSLLNLNIDESNHLNFTFGVKYETYKQYINDKSVMNIIIVIDIDDIVDPSLNTLVNDILNTLSHIIIKYKQVIRIVFNNKGVSKSDINSINKYLINKVVNVFDEFKSQIRILSTDVNKNMNDYVNINFNSYKPNLSNLMMCVDMPPYKTYTPVACMYSEFDTNIKVLSNMIVDKCNYNDSQLRALKVFANEIAYGGKINKHLLYSIMHCDFDIILNEHVKEYIKYLAIEDCKCYVD